MRSKAIIPAALLIGIVLVGYGLGIVPLTTTGSGALVPSITGTQAIDQTTCKNGFGVGQCDIVTFYWNGNLVNPNTAAIILSNYDHQTITSSCGISGLYTSNIPVVTGQGGKPDAQYAPINTPSGWDGVLVYNGIVYLQDGTYSSADGCGTVNTTQTTTATSTQTNTGTGGGFPSFGFPGGALGTGGVTALLLAGFAAYVIWKKGKVY